MCSEDLKKSILNEYFIPNNMNYNICRLSIGSSDFNLKSYSYSNKVNLSDFSISEDLQYVIPIIKEANNNESFSNVNPTTSNMAYGFFGIGGFSVVCTANFDKARIDFFLGKSYKEKNKEAFDIL